MRASPWRRPTTGIVAHRGGKDEAPENTLYAMKEAVRAGAHAIECDVQGTADGVPVVIHDEDLRRVAGDPRRVDEITLDELRNVDPCVNHAPLAGIVTGATEPPNGFNVADFRIPTLAEFLDAFTDTPLIVEMKDTAPAEPVAELLGATGRGPEIMVIAFDDDQTDAVKELAPEVATAPGIRGVLAFQAGRRLTHDALNVPYEVNGQRLVTEAFVHRAHAEDMAVLVWTVNNEDTARLLVDIGVDYIATDRPRAFGVLLFDQDAAE